MSIFSRSQTVAPLSIYVYSFSSISAFSMLYNVPLVGVALLITRYFSINYWYSIFLLFALPRQRSLDRTYCPILWLYHLGACLQDGMGAAFIFAPTLR